MAVSSAIYGTPGADSNLTGTSGDDKVYGYGGNDNLEGGDGNDSLYAGAGDDSLYGGAGNDFLDGGDGNDSMYGGSGNDTYVVNSASDVVTELLNDGTDEVRTYIGYTLGANIENLRVLNDGGLSVNGNDLNNAIVGAAGADIIQGRGGNDSIDGKGGNDSLYGGVGNDILYGGDGNDTLIGDTGLDAFYGGAGNDVMNVEAAELKKVSGGDGWDRVNLDITSASAGVNVDMGALGIEQINGTNFADTIDGSAINTAATWGAYAQIFGGGGDDIIIGSSYSDYLEGNGGNDRIYAGAGGDAMLGGDGNDVLVGGAGADQFTGGAGNDTFVIGVGDALSAYSWAGDKILDFQQGSDKIDLSAFAGMTFANLTITYAGGHTYIAFDNGPPTGNDSYIDVTGTITFTAADFIFGP